jgi:NAD(P)-dependent dehydrogenase (short-subunit alcohol dehydrogenase family)
MRLKDKVCLITGAAGGMGLEAARLFAAEGAKVVRADVKEGPEVPGTAFVRADVSREADCRAMVEAAVSRFGGLDVLYNNAGIFPADDRSVVDADEKVWDRVFAVNVKGTAFPCKYGIPQIVRRGGGSVINVASFVAFVGCTVPQDAYTASKGAILALTKSLAIQFGPRGVRVNAICPGPIETPLLTEWLLKEPAEREKRIRRIPMGRFGRPGDVVSLALYLASDESAWTAGAAIMVDGGITSNYF